MEKNDIKEYIEYTTCYVKNGKAYDSYNRELPFSAEKLIHWNGELTSLREICGKKVCEIKTIEDPNYFAKQYRYRIVFSISLDSYICITLTNQYKYTHDIVKMHDVKMTPIYTIYGTMYATPYDKDMKEIIFYDTLGVASCPLLNKKIVNIGSFTEKDYNLIIKEVIDTIDLTIHPNLRALVVGKESYYDFEPVIGEKPLWWDLTNEEKNN